MGLPISVCLTEDGEIPCELKFSFQRLKDPNDSGNYLKKLSSHPLMSASRSRRVSPEAEAERTEFPRYFSPPPSDVPAARLPPDRLPITEASCPLELLLSVVFPFPSSWERETNTGTIIN